MEQGKRKNPNFNHTVVGLLSLSLLMDRACLLYSMIDSGELVVFSQGKNPFINYISLVHFLQCVQ